MEKLQDMGPSAIDAEIRGLSPDAGGSHDLLLAMMEFFLSWLKTRRDFEVLQAYMSVYLKVCLSCKILCVCEYATTICFLYIRMIVCTYACFLYVRINMCTYACFLYILTSVHMCFCKFEDLHMCISVNMHAFCTHENMYIFLFYAHINMCIIQCIHVCMFSCVLGTRADHKEE